MTFTQTARFTLAGKRAEITLRAAAQLIGNGRTIDLEPIPADALEYSFTGNYDGSSGQCCDSILEAAESVSARTPPEWTREIVRLCQLWREMHLNGMVAGTRAQERALNAENIVGYDASVQFLKGAGLNEGYDYGSAWLYRPIPEADVAEARELLTKLDGRRIGVAVETAEAIEQGEMDEASFSNSDDIIDSRDIIKRIEAIRDFLADVDDPDSHNAGFELATLVDLEAEAEGYAPDWQHSAALIRESYFVKYAEELANDIGAVDGRAGWPLNHIDWTGAAEQLKEDYTAVEFDGVTYWIR